MSTSASPSSKLLIDVHTHIYTPRLVSLLRSRTTNPRIYSAEEGQEKLAILPNEPAGGGRPVGAQYWSRTSKLAFMDRHRIDLSVVSIANPWLDWMKDPSEAVKAAHEANEDLVAYCAGEGDENGPGSAFTPGDARSNFKSPLRSTDRLRAFGILPFADGVPVEALLAAVDQIASHAPQTLCGAILGTRGLGRGLDDPRLEPLWRMVEEKGLMLFLHPHYGIGDVSGGDQSDSLFGARDNGHILPLALGFPYETAAATSRLILAGVLDRYPDLRLLLAHSGGALPLLSSRLASCVSHETDTSVRTRLAHDARYYLGQLYYDAVSYGPEELWSACSIVGRAHRFRRGGPGVAGTPRSLEGSLEEVQRGAQRFVWGTDHPFFPPLQQEKQPATSQDTSGEQMPWPSVTENVASVHAVPGWTEQDRRGVMSDNARRLLRLKV